MTQTAHFVAGGERVRVKVHPKSRLSADEPRFAVESTTTEDEWAVSAETLVREYRPISEMATQFVSILIDKGFGSDSQ